MPTRNVVIDPSPKQDLGPTNEKVVLALSFSGMSVLVVILPLECIQPDIDLVREDRKALHAAFPPFEHFAALVALGHPVLFLRFDADPVIHRDRPLLEKKVFDRSTTS